MNGCSFKAENNEQSDAISADEDSGALVVDTTCAVPPTLGTAQACAVAIAPEKSLLINDVGVVEDAIRTRWKSGGIADDDRSGIWHFGRIMTEVLKGNSAAASPAKRVETWFRKHWIDTVPVARRPALEAKLLGAWPRVGGELNLKRPPLRLLAIAMRVDLRNPSTIPHQGRANFPYAGELRFVYGVLNSEGKKTPFTIIVEFAMPLKSRSGEIAIDQWARDITTLSQLEPGDCEYNMKLEQITRRVTRMNTMKGYTFNRGDLIPNNSALLQVRSNERIDSGQHDFREWYQSETQVSSEFGNLVIAINSDTPRDDYNGTDDLAARINGSEEIQWGIFFQQDNSSRILATRGSGNLASSGKTYWHAPRIECLNPTALGFSSDPTGLANCSSELRHRFSLNTCTGCHAREAGIARPFHVRPRNPGEPSDVSPFLTGIEVADPETGKVRTLNDLSRRAADLRVAMSCTP
jgi:hypothetical protein